MPLLILENNFSYTQGWSQWLCSVLNWKGKNTIMMVNYSSVLLQKHYNFADLFFTKLFSKYCRYHLDFRIFAPANERKKEKQKLTKEGLSTTFERSEWNAELFVRCHPQFPLALNL